MVRNGLGVDARGGRVRAASATAASRVVVLQDGVSVDLADALRAALASARARFGEPEAIALVHDDDLSAADLERVRAEARDTGIGDVQLVPDSVARSFAGGEEVPAEVVAAMGAAIWLLRDRRGIVVPPVLPPAQGDPEGTKQMSDFGSGSAMDDHGDGRTMGDFGDGRKMAEFGAGVTMADFGDAPRRGRRSRILVAALAAAVVIIAGAAAAIGLSSPSSDTDRVAATETTSTTEADDRSTTSTSASGDVEAGDRTTPSVADGPSGSDVTTTTAASDPSGGSTATTLAGSSTTTTVAMATRTYDVVATVISYASEASEPRLTQGQTARGTVTLTCPVDAPGDCTGSIQIPDFNYAIASFPAEVVEDHVDYSATEPVPGCADGTTNTVAFSADFSPANAAPAADGTTSQTHKPSRTCQGSDGRAVFHEDIAISFGTPPR